ncbi:hypothetical protein C8J57DRAFT_539430 [Mycena rebaudengoi]|nr:hypothetical protein C8J57DRAFT_539430 [Mycena rebaudengoi]
MMFYKEKQKRRGGDPARFMEAIGISPTDELAIFWNTHQRIDDAVAEGDIAELAALTPPVALAVPSPLLPVLDAPHAVPPADAISREPSSHVLAPATSTAPVGRPVVRCQSESTLNIGKATHAQPFLTRTERPAPVPAPSAQPALNCGLRRSSTLRRQPSRCTVAKATSCRARISRSRINSWDPLSLPTSSYRITRWSRVPRRATAPSRSCRGRCDNCLS